MRHYITTAESITILRLIEKVATMATMSANIAALCDIKKGEVDLILEVKKRIKQ